MADYTPPIFDVGGSVIDTGAIPIEVPPVYTPPPVDLSGLFPPVPAPNEPFPGAPVVELPPFPAPVITLEPPPVIAYPPPVEVPLPPPALPPIGYDANGNPIYTVTTNIPNPSPPPLPPGPVIQLPTPPPVVTTQSGGGATAIAIATINQNLQILNQDITPLVQGIKDALAQSAQEQADIARNTANQIAQSLGGFTNGLFGWVRDLFGWLKDNIGSIVQGIAHVFENIGQFIYNAIKTIGDNIFQFFRDTVSPILSDIGQAVINIANFYQQHIEPILTAIAKIQQVVAASIVAIEKDIQGGLQGILKLPSDLANAFQSIDQALIRAGRALKVHQASDADFYYVTGDGKGFAQHIQSLGDAISGRSPVGLQTTYNPGTLDLSEPTLAQELPKMIDAMNTIMLDIAKAIYNIVGDPKRLVEAVGVGAIGGLIELAEPFEAVKAIWDIMKAPFDIISELAAERVREATTLTKLDVGTLAAAWRRSLITKENMDAELATQGYNGARSELLRRLTNHVEDAPTLVDLLYREIILDDDFVRGLRDLGYTDAQITALRDSSNQLLDVTTALTAWRRGDIDEAQVNSVFAVNRWNDAERDLIKGLTYAPPNYSSAYGYSLVHRFLNFDNIPLPTLDEVPQVVKDAGKADGLNDDAILAQWTAQVNTLPATAWVNLYWRGYAKRAEVEAAMLRDRVPQELWANWIDSQRPLIPFRTIPGMIAAGIMTDAEGLDYLQMHGYALQDAVRLLEYAKRGSKSSKAGTAAAQHDISLTQAKSAYQDGVLTKDQYLALLKAHGLDDNAAALEVELVDIAEETKARKQIGIDIVNEYQAGLIDQETALQQLAASGYTIAEQAKIAKQIRSTGATKAKLPSEAELRAFATHDIITPDEYQNRLIVIGYTAEDAANFRALHFPVQ